MKRISVVNMKGGVSKTTLAVNIADCLCERHQQRVILIDIDPQFNATQCLIAGEDYAAMVAGGTSTIVDVFDNMPRPSAGTVSGLSVIPPKRNIDIKPTKLKENLFILPGNLQLFRLEMSPGEGREFLLTHYLDSIEGSYDYAIIDTPPTPSVWMSTALIASQYYLVPCKPEPLSGTGIDLLRVVVDTKKENYALKIKCAGLVLTMAQQHTKAYKETVEFIDSNPYWRNYRFKYELPLRTEIAYLQGSQTTILSSKSPELKTAITRITGELIERIS